MERKLARVVQIDGISPIIDADMIEVATVGGWKIVVKKGEFAPGDRAVYFEIDTFLPEGNPAWQFLVDKSSRTFLEVRGHVLRSVKLRGQVSQGLLLPLSVLPSDVELNCQLDDDVSSALGVTKYEPPLPAQLAGVARGPYPSRVPRTDQERVQNLSEELRVWCETRTEWEVTEKLEGASCTFMLIDGELHVCSRNLDLVETPENTLWKVARELEIEERFRDHADVHDLKSFAVQGELVGPSIQDNIYKLTQHAFYVFDIYDVERGYMLRPAERRETVSELGLLHVPVFGNLTLDETLPMDKLLEVADGSSQLLLSQPREGIVFKSRTTDDSFKVISNKYLLKQKS